MTATTTDDGYVLGRGAPEYERLREQARAWEAATGRLLDQIELAPGARCLDAGCGPGETMRLLAQRVGPGGEVVGVDVDERAGAEALAALRDAGHRQCAFARHDLTAPGPLPGAPYDLVYARLLLMHLPQPLPVLRRLWEAVAPGGHLVIQDFDLRTVGVVPALPSLDEFRRVVFGTFLAAGRGIALGHRLPQLFEQAGIGGPDGTDVAGRLEPLGAGGAGIAAVWRSVLPAAVALGQTTAADGAAAIERLERDIAAHGDHTLLWPLLIGAWKRRRP
jgi:SAM-dependent methyltransferase